MAVTLEVKTRGVDGVSLEVRRIPDRALDAADRTIGLATEWLRSEIVEKKLSGQVLNVQTGTLRRSIRAKKVEKGRWRVVIGAEGWYGVLHEYGLRKKWWVGSAIKARRGGKWFYVGWHPGLKKRSFMRTALAERRARIARWVGIEVAKALGRRFKE